MAVIGPESQNQGFDKQKWQSVDYNKTKTTGSYEGQSIPWSLMQERLFDRETQKEKLVRAYKRIIQSESNGVREIALVTGPSGTGKTCLAQSIKKKAMEDGCYFLYGKCEQIQTQEPFSPFVQAVTGFVETIVANNDPKERLRVKEAVKKATKESDADILLDMLPVLRCLLEDGACRKGVIDLAMLSGKNRHRKPSRPNAESPSIALFCRFAEELFSTKNPAVVLIDDWQWFDPSSLSLLSAIASARKVSGFMLVGTCRSDEVGVGDELSVVLRSLEETAKVVITDIQIGNLRPTAVKDIVEQLLGPEVNDANALASKVHVLTHGNVFLVRQCLMALVDSGLLYYDKEKWRWNESSIDSSTLTQGSSLIPSFIIERISSVSPATREVLQVSACLGSRFSSQHVRLILEPQGMDVDEAFLSLTKRGIFVKRHSGDILKWSHDRFQHAAFVTIPDGKRSGFHASIGQKLLHRLSAAELVQNTLLVANLLLFDTTRLLDDHVRRDAATLFCEAGYKAAQSSAFEESAKYFLTGIGLLAPNRWEQSYALTLRLYNGAAEMEFCLGNTARVDHLTGITIENARCVMDKIRAYETRILSLSARNDMHACIRLAFEVLRKVGEPLPHRSNRLRDLCDLVSVRLMLRNKTTHDILSLPKLEIWSKLVMLRVLNLIFPAILRVRADLSVMFAAKGVKTTIQYGLSPMACPAFLFLGMIICHPVGDISEGTRLADMGAAIFERFNSADLRCRVLCVESAFCRPWKESVRSCLPVRLSAASSGILSGDIELAFLNHVIYSLEGFACGFGLRKHFQDMLEIKQRYDGLNQDTVMAYLSCLLQLAENLCESGSHGSELRGQYFALDESKLVKEGKIDEAEVAVYRFSQLYLALFLGDHEVAARIGAKIMKGVLDGMSAFAVMSMTFMAGLAELIHARDARKNNPRAGKAALRKLVQWAKFSPENLLSRIYFIEAEMYAMEGRRERALRKYKLAIDEAADQGFIHEQAFACERAAVSLREWNNNTEALNCFRRARYLYAEWGSPLKAAQMDKRIAGAECSSGYF